MGIMRVHHPNIGSKLADVNLALGDEPSTAQALCLADHPGMEGLKRSCHGNNLASPVLELMAVMLLTRQADKMLAARAGMAHSLMSSVRERKPRRVP